MRIPERIQRNEPYKATVLWKLDEIVDYLRASRPVAGTGISISESACGMTFSATGDFVISSVEGEKGETGSNTGSEYDGPFKVAIINKALANPPEEGWTEENMPTPLYKICVYDGRIADDVALNSTASDLQAGYAQYNGTFVMCMGKEFALPKASRYLVLTIEVNVESGTYTQSFELVTEVTSKRNDLKQQFPIAYISYVAPPAPPERTERTPAEQAAIDANAHSIKQYYHNVPQLWSFKVCLD